MIGETGHPTGHLAIPQEETTMFKTISAALLAASVLAAPAFAAGQSRTAHSPAVKAVHATTVHVKPSLLNANARMGRHHHAHRHFRHYRSHRH